MPFASDTFSTRDDRGFIRYLLGSEAAAGGTAFGGHSGALRLVPTSCVVSEEYGDWVSDEQVDYLVCLKKPQNDAVVKHIFAIRQLFLRSSGCTAFTPHPHSPASAETAHSSSRPA